MRLPNRQRLIMGSIALILLCLGIWKIEAAQNGLQRISGEVAGLPFRIVAPEKALDGSRPLVLVAHGLAGSATVMEGFTTTLAQAGYVVASC